MNIIDLHCDVLMKLRDARDTLSFTNATELNINKDRLIKGEVKVQCFAIFLEQQIPSDQKFQVALEQIDYFYREVLEKNPEMKQITNWSDFDRIKDGEIGAMLTLEGVEPIGNDITKLNILYQLGVRSIGLTWNPANLAADGVGEPRAGGLTLFGKEIVQWNNEHHVLTDVSHLCECSFWDVMELAQYPIASHSNARKICDHPRNLTDEQARAMFKSGGMIHVAYFPDFIREGGIATIDDLITHIDHFCSLGGKKQIGLGSDFDGIPTFVQDLEDASKSQHLIEKLLLYFNEEEVKGFAYQNFLDHRPKDLRI